MEEVQKDQQIKVLCYLSNNRYAYFDDIGDAKHRTEEIKIYNFVPTYDHWCLYCSKKDAPTRCSRCKTIYFCDKTCQSKAWPIHKKHCGRNQFILCCACGQVANDVKSARKCQKCPVMFCSEKCQRDMQKAHDEFDCDHFGRLFKN